MIEPNSWTGQGGEGNIVIVDHTLIVKNQYSVQKQVAEFLIKLQKADQLPYQRGLKGSMGDGNGNLGGMGGGAGGGMGGMFRVPPAVGR